MSKYSKSQLLELAKGVFKGSPALQHVYANDAGTFNNEQQFASKNAKQQEGFIKITRAQTEGRDADTLIAEAASKLAKKQADKEAADAAKAEAAAKKAAEKDAATKAKAKAAAAKAKE